MSKREMVLQADMAVSPAEIKEDKYKRFFSVFFKRPLVVLGTILILIFILVAIFAPLIAPYPPNHQDLANILLPPSREHLFGTDALGRDVFSRIIFGTRIAIVVGVASLAISAILGVILGVAAGYYGGLIETIIMRIVDALMTFPFILLALTISALLGGGIQNVIIALGIGNLPTFARMMYSQTIAIKENEFIMAGRSLGCSNLRIIFKHILPNALSPIIVLITMNIGGTILAEAALSFLEIGIKPPTPAWGSLVYDGYAYLVTRPLLSIAPGIAIMIVVFGFNMLGDGLRDALDPRLRGII